jgi:hypothetical protein
MVSLLNLNFSTFGWILIDSAIKEGPRPQVKRCLSGQPRCPSSSHREVNAVRISPASDALSAFNLEIEPGRSAIEILSVSMPVSLIRCGAKRELAGHHEFADHDLPLYASQATISTRILDQFISICPAH